MRGISGDFDLVDQLLIRYSSVVRYLGIQHDNISVIKEAYDSVNGASSEEHCNRVWFSHENSWLIKMYLN